MTDGKHHLYMNVVAIIKIIADDVDRVDVGREVLARFEQDIYSLCRSKIELFLGVYGPVHEGGVCSNDGER